MKLEDLRPKEVKLTALDVELTFRPFTIADDLKAHDLCGGKEGMIKAFEEFDFGKLSLLAWYQLTLESQKEVLSAVEGVFIDPETGEEVKANLKPIDKFRSLFLGDAGKIDLLTNFIRCKGVNLPDLDDEEALKKWIDQLNKISPGLTGQKSLI